jgi:phospholipase/carboxylesterase
MTDQAIIRDLSQDIDAAVVWMHGLGADGNDFVPIVDELGLQDFNIRFVFPHAPSMPVTVNMGMQMPAWYDIREPRLEQNQDRDGIENSRLRVDSIVDTLLQQGIASQRIVLAGFSQGGAMALHCGLRQPHTLAGIMALSSYLPLAESARAEKSTANDHTPIFMAHGQFDPVVPISNAIASRRRLTEMGYQVKWHEYPMQHSVCLEEVRDIGYWLKKILA